MSSPRHLEVTRRVACIIPANDAQDTIAATVQAARRLAGVEVVFVCDDGSRDETGTYAHGAGAIVVSHQRSRGRAAAIESAVNALGVLEQRDSLPESTILLLLDAELGDAASACGALIDPIAGGQAALCIAVPPAGDDSTTDSLAATAATRGIAELTGWTPRAALSGQRCLTRRAFELASPLAAGWGADVGMTIDVLRAGLRVVEIELDLPAPASRGDLGAQLDRARQLADVTRALTARGLVGSRLADLKESGGVSGLLKRIAQ